MVGIQCGGEGWREKCGQKWRFIVRLLYKSCWGQQGVLWLFIRSVCVELKVRKKSLGEGRIIFTPGRIHSSFYPSIHLSIHPSNKDPLNIYYVPGTVLDTGGQKAQTLVSKELTLGKSSGIISSFNKHVWSTGPLHHFFLKVYIQNVLTSSEQTMRNRKKIHPFWHQRVGSLGTDLIMWWSSDTSRADSGAGLVILERVDFWVGKFRPGNQTNTGTPFFLGQLLYLSGSLMGNMNK
jgi:hypothetical protein